MEVDLYMQVHFEQKLNFGSCENVYLIKTNYSYALSISA